MDDELVAMFATTQHRALVMVCQALGAPQEGLTMAGQMAKRRGLLQGPMAKKLARLDTAAHYVRHCTRQKMQQFVDQLEAALATKPAMDEEGTKEKVDTN